MAEKSRVQTVLVIDQPPEDVYRAIDDAYEQLGYHAEVCTHGTQPHGPRPSGHDDNTVHHLHPDEACKIVGQVLCELEGLIDKSTLE